MEPKKKLIRITTVPISLEKLLSGQLEFMKAHYEVVAVSSEPDKLADFGKSQGVRTKAIGLTRKLTPIQDLKALFQLYFYLRKERPFIVHSHTPKAGTIGMLAAWMAGVPHRLHTVAGLPLLVAKGNKRRLLDFVENITYASATKVYPNSNGLRDIILQNGYCKPGKLKVIGKGSSNGIDTAYFDPTLFPETDRLALRTQFGISPTDTVFLFVGRLVKDKGIQELVEAFSRLETQFPDARLWLVGNYEADLDPLDSATLTAIKNSPKIIEAGYQNDVRPFLAASDVLAFPSYREGFPNVVLQAGAMQLPSIVSNINGCNEIISHRENGLIIPPADASALQKAMVEMLTHKEMVVQMSKVCRLKVQENYEQNVVWNAILAEYRALERRQQ